MASVAYNDLGRRELVILHQGLYGQPGAVHVGIGLAQQHGVVLDGMAAVPSMAWATFLGVREGGESIRFGHGIYE